MHEAEAKVQHLCDFWKISKPQKISCWLCNSKFGARMEKVLSVVEGFARTFKSAQGNPVAVLLIHKYDPVQSRQGYPVSYPG